MVCPLLPPSVCWAGLESVLFAGSLLNFHQCLVWQGLHNHLLWGVGKRLPVSPSRDRGLELGLRSPFSVCSSQEPACCAGWRQQGDECGVGEWGTLGTWAAGRDTERREQCGGRARGSSGPSCPQRCARATPRARRTKCACARASAAAAMATLVPTATRVSRGPRWGLGSGAGPLNGEGSDPETRSSMGKGPQKAESRTGERF